jgi:excisionase family DNA binding protein
MEQKPEYKARTPMARHRRNRYLHVGQEPRDEIDGGANIDGRPVYLDIREVSRHLKIKTSTLYAWVARRKIPFIKIHGLIRFRIDEIDRWVESFRKAERQPLTIPSIRSSSEGIDDLIARAKRAVYTPHHGETGPKSSLIRKGEHDGAE